MIHLDDIHSLTDFARNTKAFAKKLKKTGRPTILTVNGRAEFVVQDAKSYQHLLDMSQYVEDRLKLDQAIDEMEAGRSHTEEEAMAMLGLKVAKKTGRK
ncbi:MAG: type II toxin-antitoxin system Phd/YefM family antitoxin [Alphaproteobacteria bacterium]|nr:type II toxin-antitoxin system Phd/YefM family antitoxin [Alphaproteobacteria bacterium]